MPAAIPDSARSGPTSRLEGYESATSGAMVALAIAYLAVYAVQVLASLPEPAATALEITSNVIWAVFVIDLAVRVWLAPSRASYLAQHPIDVIAAVVPAFRVLRVLRVLTAGQWLMARGHRLAAGRTAAAIVTAVAVLAVMGALAVLDAERGAEGANIADFGDALWWALTTMSTVGYGDRFPVTVVGRLVAVGMMIVGVSLLGVVSGTLASSFLTKIRGEQRRGDEAVLEQLARLQEQVEALTRAVVDADRQPGHPQDLSTEADPSSQGA